MTLDRVTFERKIAKPVRPAAADSTAEPSVAGEVPPGPIAPESKLSDRITGLGYLGLGALSFACIGDPVMVADWWEPVILPIFAAEASVSIAIPFCAGYASQSSGASRFDMLFPVVATTAVAIAAFAITMQENGFGDRNTGGWLTIGAYLVMLGLRLRDAFFGTALQRSRAYTLTLGPLSIAAVLGALIVVPFDFIQGKGSMWMLIAGLFFSLLALMLLFMDLSRLQPMAGGPVRRRGP